MARLALTDATASSSQRRAPARLEAPAVAMCERGEGRVAVKENLNHPLYLRSQMDLPCTEPISARSRSRSIAATASVPGIGVTASSLSG